MRIYFFLVLLVLLLSPTAVNSSLSSAANRPQPPPVGCFSSIFSFGDSITDTGNHCYLLSKSGHGKLQNNCFLPYGETFFHRPTGSSSDGRLIIDFIAEYLGLPLVPPYFGGSSNNFDGGVNFAVGTATALDSNLLGATQGTNVSLRVQFDLFKQLLPSLCGNSYTNSGCKDLLKKSLFLLGEIGGNDYNFPLTDGFGFEQVQQLVPLVVRCITSTLQELIELGAVNILIPGNFPIGCLPFYLNKLKSSNLEDYDPSTGCLNWLNQLASYHNELLQSELNSVRKLHPNINIVYVDYYNAALRIYRTPTQFGFGFFFALFDEDLKPGPSSERSFGLFKPDLSMTYDVGLSKTTSPQSPPPSSSSGSSKTPSTPQATQWCVSKPGVSQAQLQASLDYACGQGVDCTPLLPGGACFEPNTVESHAAYAMNLYFQRSEKRPWNCDFSQTAALTSKNPSYNGCNYPGGST